MATSLTAVLRLLGTGEVVNSASQMGSPVAVRLFGSAVRLHLSLAVNEDFLSLCKRGSLVPYNPLWEDWEESGAHLT